jgi:hypothetical protein
MEKAEPTKRREGSTYTKKRRQHLHAEEKVAPTRMEKAAPTFRREGSTYKHREDSA